MHEFVWVLDALETRIRGLQGTIHLAPQPLTIGRPGKHEPSWSVPCWRQRLRLPDDDRVTVLTIDAVEYDLGAIATTEHDDLAASPFQTVDGLRCGQLCHLPPSLQGAPDRSTPPLGQPPSG